MMMKALRYQPVIMYKKINDLQINTMAGWKWKIT